MPKVASEKHGDRRDDRPDDLDPAVPAVGRPVGPGVTGAERDEHEADEEQHEEQDGRQHRDEHGVVEHLPGRLDAPVPGRKLGPEEDRDDRRAITLRDDPEDQEAAAVPVRGRGAGRRRARQLTLRNPSM